MSVIEVEKLLHEVSAEAPSGTDLEYDPAFVELVRISQGKPERQMGDAVVQAEEPDWRGVKKLALQLLGRSKDLRLSVYLARALIKVDGFPGLSDGLHLIRGLLDKYWETVHPQLDPEDNSDPTMRVNTLVTLCDPDAMLHAVRESPLVSSRALGRFSLREIQIATGKAPAPGGDAPPPEMSAIEAAFMDTDLDALQATADAVGQSIERIGAIESVLTEKVGAAQAADFSPLADVLKSGQRVLSEQLARRGVAVAPVEGEAAGVAAGGVAVSGTITTREDAVRILDKVCDYFQRHEPSSPVPILLRRAKGLVSKDFMDIVRDLAPDGVPQVENIRGSSGEES